MTQKVKQQHGYKRDAQQFRCGRSFWRTESVIETITRYGAGRNTWLNVSGGVGNETLSGLSVASTTNDRQCIAIRMVLENGAPVPILNPRLLNAYKSTRIRLPGIYLKPGQRLECYSSEYADWTMMLTPVIGARPRTNRAWAAPPVGDWSAISPPGAPFEITSVLCVNKTEAEARAGLRFRNHPGGSAGVLFLDEIVPPRSTYRAVLPHHLIAASQSLDVFSTCDCAWVVSGVTA